jgi:hypothetical protein
MPNSIHQLSRELAWEFDTAELPQPTAEALARRLTQTDVLVNFNKHRARWWIGPINEAPFPRPAPSQCIAGLLVSNRDDSEAHRILHILQHRLGFYEISAARHATLWWITTAKQSNPIPIATYARDMLLANPASQEATVLLAP